MMPATTTIEPPDQLDPWGFGVTDADRPVLIAWREPLDEPVDDKDALDLPGPPLLTRGGELPQAAVPLLPAPARSPAFIGPLAASPADRALLRLPFPADRIGLMALFAAVIVAQAFYIGVSLTGEASARPAGVVPVTPLPVVAPVAHVKATAEATLPPAVGLLKIDTGTAAADVSVDGATAGKTPLAITGLAAGAHTVRVRFSGGAVVDRAITVAAGETVALVIEPPPARPVAPAGPASGWVRIAMPFDVQVFENGQLVDTSASERIMVPAGGHVLELVNTALGYRAITKAVVLPGKVASLVVDVPDMPVAINAQPWAEVEVEGRVIGETPLANLMLPIGVHQILFRHPDLGERTETVTVRATGANRVSADLRR